MGGGGGAASAATAAGDDDDGDGGVRIDGGYSAAGWSDRCVGQIGEQTGAGTEQDGAMPHTGAPATGQGYTITGDPGTQRCMPVAFGEAGTP